MFDVFVLIVSRMLFLFQPRSSFGWAAVIFLTHRVQSQHVPKQHLFQFPFSLSVPGRRIWLLRFERISVLCT